MANAPQLEQQERPIFLTGEECSITRSDQRRWAIHRAPEPPFPRSLELSKGFLQPWVILTLSCGWQGRSSWSGVGKKLTPSRGLIFGSLAAGIVYLKQHFLEKKLIVVGMMD
jgi:hypothetical protein